MGFLKIFIHFLGIVMLFICFFLNVIVFSLLINLMFSVLYKCEFCYFLIFDYYLYYILFNKQKIIYIKICFKTRILFTKYWNVEFNSNIFVAQLLRIQSLKGTDIFNFPWWPFDFYPLDFSDKHIIVFILTLSFICYL